MESSKTSTGPGELLAFVTRNEIGIMLNKNAPRSGVVLVGSTSDIGHAILHQLKPKNKTPLIMLGRDETSTSLVSSWPGPVTFLHCDLRNIDEIRNVFEKLRNVYRIDFAIVASAHLPKEFNEGDFDSVLETFSINSTGVALVLSCLSSIMAESGGTLVLISSVATLRPRIKNFTYGASKLGADYFALGLAAKNRGGSLDVKVVRPGYVFSKLSKGFPVAPFATYPSRVAKDVIRGINRSPNVIYSPRILGLVMRALRILPSRLFHRL
jgi:decaprenylphospho-beta-D-erythro-pentofuranosid-2-ulose 2-reductase